MACLVLAAAAHGEDARPWAAHALGGMQGAEAAAISAAAALAAELTDYPPPDEAPLLDAAVVEILQLLR